MSKMFLSILFDRVILCGVNCLIKKKKRPEENSSGLKNMMMNIKTVEAKTIF